MKNTTSIQRKHMSLFRKGMLTVSVSMFCFFSLACAEKEPIDEDDIDPAINPPITFVEDDEEGTSAEDKTGFPDFGYNEDPLAFPGAEGYGRYATGARGSSQREIYRVTNLNTSGNGSFKDAISKENRIIVFAVAGVLDMKKETYVLKDNQTLLFETAPGDGFELYNGRVSSSGASNLIVRYMRVRMGRQYSGSDDDDAGGCANGENQIYDHCSFTWGCDENFSLNRDGKAPLRNITLQNSIIGQGCQNHSCGGLIQTNLEEEEGITIYRNLLIDNKTRNFKVKGLNQFVNNVVYNWGNGAAYNMGGESKGTSNTTIVNNYFIKGSAYTWVNTAFLQSETDKSMFDDETKYHYNGEGLDKNKMPIYYADVYQQVSPTQPFTGGDGTGDFYSYITGNFYDENKNGKLDGIELTRANWNTYCSKAYPIFLEKADEKHPTIKNQTTATEAYNYIVEKVGAYLPHRDNVDRFMIEEELLSLGTKGTILRNQQVVQQYPLANTWQNMDTTNNIIDTDGDGLPDDFEDKWGLDKKNKYDAIRTANNGYLNIENYAFSLEYPELYEKAYQKWINH